ncbi:hypothetical protein [Nonomuraea jiangxiensis]|uniref:Uncharacterized protein n=1 Tax=Nonomuraea jiangxiensis TaxID=633440 RepID=A0A1G8PYC5_9ACTN|nr:hypothetical protein [Nonomuraea jiangxiensis]SDI96830.1 hypothetical protein SAMN05421869_10853 [Nonomuraea jiangxiensis]
MAPTPPERASGRRAVLALLFVILLGGVWLITTVELPTAPEETPATDSAEPARVRVTLDPPDVPVGTKSVRVTAHCAHTDSGAIAGSAAFSDTSTLDESSPGGDGVQADVELGKGLRAGAYEVTVLCYGDSRLGTATLTVIGSAATPSPSKPQRTATTTIVLAEARPGAWRRHPDADFAIIDRTPDLGGQVFQLTVTHELRLPDDDPVVTALRAGAAGYSATTFVENRLGSVGADANSRVLSTVFTTPTIRVERGSGQAVVTFTGVEYGNYHSGDDSYVGIEFSPPADEGVPPLSAHEIVISAAGWMVAGVHGSPPLTQDRHYLRLDGDRPIRAAFVREGRTAAVAEYLIGDQQLGERMEEGRDDAPQEEPIVRADYEFLGRAGSALESTAWMAVSLAVVYCLARALGGQWWRRPRNWLLLAIPVAVFFLISQLTEWASWTAFGLLGVGLPLLSLLSAARAVNSKSPLVAGAVAMAMAGVTLSIWGLVVVSGQAAAAWWLAAAAGLTAVAAAVPWWRRALPAVAFLVLGSGVLLAARALLTGIAPGIAVWQLLLAVAGATLAFGWGVEANHGWTPRTGIWCVAVVPVSLGVLMYAMWPEEWILGAWVWHDTGSFDYDNTIVSGLFYGVILLAFAMLIVRVQRIGRTAAALTTATAWYTAVLYLMVLHWPLAGDISFHLVMPLVAWAALAWLLSGTAPPTQVSQAEHRILVRDLLRRRHIRATLTDLLRQRQETSLSAFKEQRTSLERAADESAGPVDSDFALSTLAGRTPWQNGLVALAAGTLLSLPYSTVRVAESAETWRGDGLQFVGGIFTLLSLPALCMVFGYFYSRVRGAGPITKSLALLVAALLTELPLYVRTLAMAMTEDPNLAETPPPTSEEALIGVLVGAGNIAVVTIGLGLWWEWRLMALAGEPWVRIRNIRSIRALAAPLATVAIAIATTATTVLVNNVITPLPAVQAPTPSTERTPSP